VLSAAEARVHPQVAARALLDGGADRPRLAFPARLDGERPRSGTQVPKLGEQTKALLAELGYPRGVAKVAGVGARFSFRRWLRRFL
jgi:crotonobetainyl-CoA:carnitine CoA-transferase CaiB-like acyl-CoA transferase